MKRLIINPYLIPGLPRHKASPESIDRVVSKVFGVPVEEMWVKTRKREIVMARQVAQYFYKKKTNMSLAEIGEQTGGKDHSTVLYSCKQVVNLYETDKEYRKKVRLIESLIN